MTDQQYFNQIAAALNAVNDAAAKYMQRNPNGSIKMQTALKDRFPLLWILHGNTRRC